MGRLPVWGDEGAFGDRWWQSWQNDVNVLNAIELKKANFMFYRFYQNKNRADSLWSSAPSTAPDSVTRVLWHWQPFPGSPEAPPPPTLLSRSLRAPQARPEGAFPDLTLPRAAWLLHCLGPLWVSSMAPAVPSLAPLLAFLSHLQVQLCQPWISWVELLAPMIVGFCPGVTAFVLNTSLWDGSL